MSRLAEAKRPAPLTAGVVVLALLALALMGVSPFERQLRQRIGGVAQRITAYIQTETGLRLSFETLSPSVLKALSLGRLVVSTEDGRELLSARRVDLYYSLRALLFRRSEGFLTEIRFEQVEARLWPEDLETLKALARKFGSGGAAGLPGFLISGRGVRLELNELAPMRLSLDVKRVQFDGRSEEASLETEGEASFRDQRLGSVWLPFRVTGNLSRDMERARLRVDASLDTGLFSVNDQEFDLSYEGSSMELRKVRDAAALDLLLRYDFASERLSGNLRIDDYSLSTFIGLKGRWRDYAPLIAAAYTGSVAAEIQGRDLERLSYSVNLEGPVPESLLPGGYAGKLRAEGTMRSASISLARLSGPLGRIEYTGDFDFGSMRPEGTARIDLALLDGRLPARAAVDLYGQRGSYAAYIGLLSLGGVEFQSVSLEAGFSGRQVDFSLRAMLPDTRESGAGSAAFSGELDAETGFPRLIFEGSLELGAAPLLEASLSVETASLAPLRNLAALFLPDKALDIVSSVSVDGEIFVASDLKRISYSTTDLVLVSSRAPGLMAVLSAAGSERDLRVRSLGLTYRDYHAEASGQVDFLDLSNIGFSTNLVFEDVPYAFSGSLVGKSLHISGDYGLELSAQGLGTSEDLVFSLKANSIPIPVPGLRLIATVDADGRFKSLEDWSLALATLSADVAPGTQAGFPYPSLTVSGLFGPESGELVSILLRDTVSSLTGSGRFRYSYRDQATIQGRIDLASAKEKYSLELAYALGDIRANLDFSGALISHVWKGPLSGTLDGSVEVFGATDNPKARVSLSMKNGSLYESTFAGELKASWDGETLGVSQFLARWAGYELSDVEAALNVKSGASSLAGRFRMSDGTELLTLSLGLAGSSRTESGASLLSAYTVNGYIRDFSYRGQTSAFWPIEILLGSEAYSFKGGLSDEVAAVLGRDGSFELVAKEPFPLRLEARGSLKAGRIDAYATGVQVQLPLVASLIGASAIRIDAGSLGGSIAIKGQMSDPEFSGSFVADGLVIGVPGWVVDTIGPFTAPLLVEGKRMIIPPVSSPVGGARVSISGSADMDGWKPSDIHVKIRSVPNQPVAMQAKVLGIGVSGSALPDLDIDLVGEVVRIGGTVTLQRADVVLSPEMFYQEGVYDSGGYSLEIGLGIRVGRGVRVYFPSKEIPIVSGYADPATKLDLKYDQGSGDLLLKGDAHLRGGDVFYIQRSFFLKKAQISFNENSDKFDPLVTLTAELRDSTAEGPVTITLRADKESIANFKPRMSSDPPLSEVEIALLLGQSLLAVDELGELDIWRVAIAGSEFLPGLNITKAFESRIREGLGLDVFFLRTQVLQRWIADYTGVGPEGVSSLADYLDETSVYAGKYLGDSVFVHGSLSLQNPLVPSGRFRLDSEIGVEFETPFGILEWKLNPKNPETLFISDQSLSLSWRLVY